MRVCELPTLEELSGWQFDEDDNPSVITESDVDDYDEFLHTEFLTYVSRSDEDDYYANQRAEARDAWRYR
jgi:hypothetical protein